MDPYVNQTFHFRHAFVRGLGAGAHYAYRVDGPDDNVAAAMRSIAVGYVDNSRYVGLPAFSLVLIVAPPPFTLLWVRSKLSG
jgi:hypothetical protein